MRVLGVRALIKLNGPIVGVEALLHRLIGREPDKRVNASSGGLVKQGAVERTRGPDAREIDHGRHDPIFELFEPQGFSANGFSGGSATALSRRTPGRPKHG